MYSTFQLNPSKILHYTPKSDCSSRKQQTKPKEIRERKLLALCLNWQTAPSINSQTTSHGAWIVFEYPFSCLSQAVLETVAVIGHEKKKNETQETK